MAKYLVLYKAGGSGPENMDDPTPDEHRAWLEWRDTVGDALVDFGSATIAVAVRDRPYQAVVADLIEGLVVVNELDGIAATRVRTAMWEAVVAAHAGAAWRGAA